GAHSLSISKSPGCTQSNKEPAPAQWADSESTPSHGTDAAKSSEASGFACEIVAEDAAESIEELFPCFGIKPDELLTHIEYVGVPQKLPLQGGDARISRRLCLGGHVSGHIQERRR